MNNPESNQTPPCASRRQFLLAGASLVVMSTLPGLAEAVALQVKNYDRRRIAGLGQLAVDQPVEFKYPFDDAYSSNFIVRLGKRAGGGVGPQQDIVAFSHYCPHMGGPLQGTYKKAHKAMGPCPLHLTTFDLTRHGMVIAGHATDSLPQIVLEVRGNDIYATGVMGLVYGRHDNLG
jgi:arsenite oxidase small subunit